MSKFGIRTFIAAFMYERVIINDGQYRARANHVSPECGQQWLTGQSMKRDWLEPMFDELNRLANEKAQETGKRWWPDNKTAFMWVDSHQMVNLMSFWDSKVTHVQWSMFWDDIPANVVQGRDQVREAFLAIRKAAA